MIGLIFVDFMAFIGFTFMDTDFIEVRDNLIFIDFIAFIGRCMAFIAFVVLIAFFAISETGKTGQNHSAGSISRISLTGYPP